MALYPRYPGEVERTIRDHCRRVGASVLAYEPGELELRPGEDGSWRLDIRRPGLSLLDTRVSLMGRHQAYNAALAVLIAQALMEQGYGITPDAIREGLMAARHPGRLELIEQTPILLLDGAHNPEGAAALATAIRDAYPSKPLVLLTAMMSNKDASGVAAQLAPVSYTHLPPHRLGSAYRDETSGFLHLNRAPGHHRDRAAAAPQRDSIVPQR